MNIPLLPIYEICTAIKSCIRDGCNLVISAPTGSGKSTQVPKMLLDELPPGKCILVLQPRRLPARVCAERVAWELGQNVGQRIGYITRFERKVSRESQVIFITEGILTRMLLDSAGVSNVHCIVFDEFHERSINADLGIALARRLQLTSRPDLRLVVMSATLNAEPLLCMLGENARHLKSDGRLFPVKISYVNHHNATNVYQAAAQGLKELLALEESGDVLIFMPGAMECRACMDECKKQCGYDGIAYHVLYGDMPVEEQHDTLRPDAQNRRKVIISTNIAETSLTIPGVRHVIDSGLVKQNRYDSARGVNLLELRPISRDSAEQRAGRAGRQSAGTCRRLWSEQEQNGRPLHTMPEIARVDLADAVMTVMAAGCHEVEKFGWFEMPPSNMLDNALNFVYGLKLADRDGLTALGRAVRHFPVHPRLGLLLYLGKQHGCYCQACYAAAVVSERRGAPQPFGLHQMKENSPEISRAMRQFQDLEPELRNQKGTPENFQRCLLMAFADHLARRISGNVYELPGRRRAELQAGSSATGAKLLVAAELHEIGAGVQATKVELALATPVDEDLLWEIFADDFSDRSEIFWDNQKQQVFRRQLMLCRNLVLEESIRNDPEPDAAAKLLASQLDANNMQLLGWDDDCRNWCNRVRWLRDVFPEQGLPDYDDVEVIRSIRLAVCCGETSYRAIRNKPCLAAIKDAMSANLVGFVEKMAPVILPLPRGRKLKLEYIPGQTPRGRARIQELYDLKGDVTVAGGRVKILLDILAPNMRTVQITDDLPRFWQVHYPSLKSALARRYPKHEWR